MPHPGPTGRPAAAELAELFSRGRPRPWRFVVPLLAGAGVLALVVSYATSGPPALRHDAPTPAEVPPAANTPFERGLVLYRQGQHGLAAVEFLAAGKAENDGRSYAYAAYCLSAGRAPVEAVEAANEAIRLGYRTARCTPAAYNHAWSPQGSEKRLRQGGSPRSQAPAPGSRERPFTSKRTTSKKRPFRKRLSTTSTS